MTRQAKEIISGKDYGILGSKRPEISCTTKVLGR